MVIPDDQALIERAKQDSAAFGELYDRYVEAVYSFALRHAGNEQVAQDITATTFEKALRHLRRFQWSGAGIRAWLLRIARNELISQQRRQRLWAFLSGNQASTINVEWLVENDERRSEVRAALNRLSAADREVLTLRFYDELTTDEIAVVLGCSKDNVYLRTHRALQRLGKELGTLAARVSVEATYVWQKETR